MIWRGCFLARNATNHFLLKKACVTRASKDTLRREAFSSWQVRTMLCIKNWTQWTSKEAHRAKRIFMRPVWKIILQIFWLKNSPKSSTPVAFAQWPSRRKVVLKCTKEVILVKKHLNHCEKSFAQSATRPYTAENVYIFAKSAKNHFDTSEILNATLSNSFRTKTVFVQCLWKRFQ